VRLLRPLSASTGKQPRFLSFLGADALRELGSITKSRITDYRNKLADKLSPATVNRDVKIIRMIFR
jgi:hypothetical protein